jgi:hypothetical protein
MGSLKEIAIKGGSHIDKVGTPMTITFNQQGELNKFDYGIDTESDSAPNLYVEFPDTNTHMQIRLILGYQCPQTRAPYGLTTDNTQEEGKLSAYDGPSIIFKEFSKIRTTVVFSATHMVSHQ